MALELLVAGSSGEVWDLASCAQRVEWRTSRTGSPGTLKCTLILPEGVSFEEGNTVRFSEDGQVQFFGWVFTISRDRWGVVEVTCYDRLRYLKATASYAFYAQTAGEIITQIAGDFQLTTGTLADTGYPIPSLIEQEQTCLDIIGAAVEQTLLNTGVLYVFYDDGDGLALQEAASMMSGVVIGDQSLLTEYTYKTDIDEQTYNSVKLVRPNEETGRADVFVAHDTETIGRWGLLQLYQTVDGAVNDAQITAQAAATLEYYNHAMRTLRIEALGVTGLRAGQMVLVKIDALGLSEYALLEQVTHSYENDIHTMTIETLSM
ncbi:MAG: hypothetical protein KH009_03640 [Clostridiales bacterium]|nr:hypothetical protein [Clostridiales bacterium]DAG69893.1 MAG TPA: 43 kDa tail protein [Caudoviricetes sp.]